MITRARYATTTVRGCAIASVCIGATYLIVIAADADAALVLAGLLLVLISAVVIVRYRRTEGDLLDPLIVISASLGWYFGIHTFWLVAHAAHEQTAFAYSFMTALAPSLALLCLGYAMLVVGFCLPRAAHHTDVSLRFWYSRRALIIVFAIGMAGYTAAAASGAYSKGAVESASNLAIYKTLGFTAIVAFVVCACQHYMLHKQNTTYRVTMWVMFVVLLIFAASVAQKAVAFTTIFAWIACRHYAGAHVRLRSVLVIAVLGLFVITPIIQMSRSGQAARAIGDQSTTASVGLTAASVPQRVQTYLLGLPSTALSGFDIINDRTNGSESLALAYRYTPAYRPYLLGEHWVTILTALIPHYIWPSKPVYAETEQFSIIYAGEGRNTGAGLSVAPTFPGNLYVNFSWPGILAGMFVLGLGLKIVANVRAAYPQPIGVAVYVAAMLAMILLEQDAEDIGSTILLHLLAAAVAFRLLRLATKGRGLVRRNPTSALVIGGR